MTYQQMMDHPAVSREEKLVATYDREPSRLSRATFSLIDAFIHSRTESPTLRDALVKAFPAYGEAVAKFEANALELDPA